MVGFTEEDADKVKVGQQPVELLGYLVCHVGAGVAAVEALSERGAFAVFLSIRLGLSGVSLVVGGVVADRGVRSDSQHTSGNKTDGWIKGRKEGWMDG